MHGDTLILGFEQNRAARTKRVIIKLAEYAVLSLIAVFLVFPFFLMVSRSFMQLPDIYALKLLPSKWTFENFTKLFTQNGYFKYLWNTVKIVLFNIVAVPLSASLCAYSFAKMKWKGKEFVFACVLSTIMIPGTVTQVPLYVMFSNLNWLNSALPLTIPTLFGGGAINIFLLRQFMRSIPKELDEAAKIDGMNVFNRYLRVTLPLCTPILLYIMVGTFASAWSDFFSPLIYLNDSKSYTLAVAIYQDSLQNSNLSTENLKMAAGVFMSLLPAFIFLVYQRKLIDGIMIGAVKG